MFASEQKLTIPQLLKNAVQEVPEKEAVYDLTKRLTYRELEEQSNILAASLAAKGIQKADRIAVSLPNWHELIIIYFAMAKLGAILVPFNPKYRLHEVQHILRDSSPKLIFMGEELYQSVGFDVIASLVPEIVTVRYEKEGLQTYEQLVTQTGLDLPEVEIDPLHDVFCILYTSGSTGLPKGALLTHYNMSQSGITVGKSVKSSEDDVYFIAAPLFHVLAIGPCLTGAVASKAKMVLHPRFRPQEALELIQQEKISVYHGVPTMFILLINHPDFAKYDVSSLRVGMLGGAACPAELLKDMTEKMKMRVCLGYGLTELGSVSSTYYDDSDKNIIETVGKALPGAQIRIVNDNREPLPTGEIGEIACKGFGIMKGYYNAPEHNQQAFDEDGWFYTGDLGRLNSEGYLYFVGRKKEMIIRGGLNIYPKEIEELLFQHPKIQEAAVVGLPDPVMGEIVCVAIRLKDSAATSSEEIKEYLKQLVAPYKIPSQVFFVDEFPRTASGKIQKMSLRDELIQKSQV